MFVCMSFTQLYACVLMTRRQFPQNLFKISPRSSPDPPKIGPRCRKYGDIEKSASMRVDCDRYVAPLKFVPTDMKSRRCEHHNELSNILPSFVTVAVQSHIYACFLLKSLFFGRFGVFFDGKSTFVKLGRILTSLFQQFPVWNKFSIWTFLGETVKASLPYAVCQHLGFVWCLQVMEVNQLLCVL